MAVTYNKMLLDINEKPNDIITAVQNDTNSRYLDVLLYDNGTPIDLTGCEVKIFMKKPENGGDIWNDGVITEAENGRCEFLLTTEALAKFGHLQVQISIWKDNEEILSSQIFEIIVTKSLLGESSLEASNEYGTLVVLFQNLYEAYDLMTRMVQNIGVPAEVAAQYDLATMWQAWEFLVAYMKGDLTTMISNALANASVQGVLDKIGDTDDSISDETLFGFSQEIYKKVTGVYEANVDWVETKTVAGTLTTSAKTVLSVTGKGTLHGFAQLHTNGTSTVQIIVDGKTIVNGKMTGTNSSYPVLLYMGKPSDVFFIADGSTTRSSMGCALLSGVSGSYSMDPLGAKGLSETQWTDSSTGGVIFIPLVMPITFYESLEIVCKGATTSDKYGCLYDLR